MRIRPPDLIAQVLRARRDWPFLDQLEQQHGLPAGLLYAVGSRETNLTDELGDGGHGHGVFQLDDRSHKIPDPFPVTLQAEIAATMLAGLIHNFDGNVGAGVCAYNAGAGAVARQLRMHRDPNGVTAGGDYGADVLERCSFIQRMAVPPPPPQEAIVVLNQPACAIVPTPGGKGYWIIAEDGGVFTYGDAPFVGSEAAKPHNAKFVAGACTPDGKGLWLLGADGGVFTEGDAPFLGSPAGGG